MASYWTFFSFFLDSYRNSKPIVMIFQINWHRKSMNFDAWAPAVVKKKHYVISDQYVLPLKTLLIVKTASRSKAPFLFLAFLHSSQVCTHHIHITFSLLFFLSFFLLFWRTKLPQFTKAYIYFTVHYVSFDLLLPTNIIRLYVFTNIRLWLVPQPLI